MNFHAFISYSHIDKPLARKLHRALENFARPWIGSRRIRVFLDKTSLGADPALSKKLKAALDGSDWLILMASKAAASSPWVAMECRYWLETKQADRIIFVLLDGDILWDGNGKDFDWRATDVLPQVFACRQGEIPNYDEMPFYVDVRDTLN